jgi:prolyl-tRNA editing enzyme YbaK/EbsC (Cys-tRNA(Pro) deacylase)
MEALTPDHVQTALHAFHLGLTIRLFPHSTATSHLAAAAIGCEVGQIAKSLCFVVQDHPILVIASGDQRVDDRKLATAAGGDAQTGHIRDASPVRRAFRLCTGGRAARWTSPPAARGVPRHRTQTLHTDLPGRWC